MAYGYEPGYGPGNHGYWQPVPPPGSDHYNQPRRRHNGWLIALLVAAALAIVGFLVWWLVGILGSSSAAQAAGLAGNKTCATAEYYAYDAPGGSDRFGPADTSTTVDAGKAHLKKEMLCDPLRAATTILFAEHGLKLDANAAEAKAADYVAHPETWAKDVNAFFKKATDWRLVNDQNYYYSIGMVPGDDSSIMPSLVRGESPVKVGSALVFTYNGVTRELRQACDDQPVEHKPFSGVPSPHGVCTPTAGNNYCGHPTCAQMHNCPTPTPKPSCTSKCTPTHPSCKSNCTPHPGCGSKCSPPPGCKATGTCPTPTPSGCPQKCGQVNVPVQESGQPTVAASNAPSTRPVTDPEPTVAPTSGNGNGYHAPSGSSAPPGTTTGGGGTQTGNPNPTTPPTCDNNCATQAPGMPPQPS